MSGSTKVVVPEVEVPLTNKRKEELQAPWTNDHRPSRSSWEREAWAEIEKEQAEKSESSTTP